MWLPGRKRRRLLYTCVFCSRTLKPEDEIAAMQEHVVRKLHGRAPAELKQPYLDPAGHERWFAHLTCMNSAALKEAGELDTTCVTCGREVDAEEREVTIDGLREELGLRPPGPGAKPDVMDDMLTLFDAALHAWQCRRCARWQCNRCVCAALADGGPPIPDHAGCGGRFSPPTSDG